jgi:predicted nuclease with RNAse H fold
MKEKIIGIDLAGDEKHKTGFALLDKKLNAKTKVLMTDEEIINETLRQDGLITIDAPLGLPKGRCCLDYDCKCNKYGYSRHAEKELRKLGVRVFPCGFAGMRKLTLRGIKLKKFFENKGREVIETYPGSAQDMLGIPRKGKDLTRLKQALIKYGFKGDVGKEKISDHELDAITSAYVGLLYREGSTIAFGLKEESQIITAKPKGQEMLKLRK